MLGFLRRLFSRKTGPDLSLWPYPLTERDVRLMLFHAVKVAKVTLPEHDADMVRLLGPNPLEKRTSPSSKEPYMTPDDLESFGLNRRLKLSAEFFLCLSPDSQKDVGSAEYKLIRHSIAAVANRRDLNRLVHKFGPKQVVEFIRDEGTCCAQSKAFLGKTWASVAPDLPLPGCSADICLCDNRAVIEF